MRRNKGFTLIELLAVIVILAIIALIATPIVLNMITTAKEGAAKSSSYGFIDAIEKTSITNASGVLDSTDPAYVDMSTLPEDGVCTKTDAAWTTCDDFMSKVSVKGDQPKTATVTIDKTSGAVTSATFTFEGVSKTFTYDGTKVYAS